MSCQLRRDNAVGRTIGGPPRHRQQLQRDEDSPALSLVLIDFAGIGTRVKVTTAVVVAALRRRRRHVASSLSCCVCSWLQRESQRLNHLQSLALSPQRRQQHLPSTQHPQRRGEKEFCRRQEQERRVTNGPLTLRCGVVALSRIAWYRSVYVVSVP